MSLRRWPLIVLTLLPAGYAAAADDAATIALHQLFDREWRAWSMDGSRRS